MNICCKHHPCPPGSDLTLNTGLRATEFDTEEELEQFLADEGPPGTSALAERLWRAGVRSLTMVGVLTPADMQSLLQDDSPRVFYLLDFARSRAGYKHTISMNLC